ncbi:MAG: prepilin-type N-terminal cleavage/methylation domain-containing protein [Deltaproteobacteria bacterium]|nr:prepilin-type N-terminal cleavage/methylation domain-containing protein [Deltaproteobacteria bacterium]
MSSFLIILCLIFALPVTVWASSFRQGLPQASLFAGIAWVGALTAGIITGAFALRSYLIKHSRFTYTGYNFYMTYYLSMLLFAVFIESFMAGLVNIDVNKNYTIAAFNISLGITLALACGKSLCCLQDVHSRNAQENQPTTLSKEAFWRKVAGLLSAAIISISILQLTSPNLPVDWFVGVLGLVLGFAGLLFLPMTSVTGIQRAEDAVSRQEVSSPATQSAVEELKGPPSPSELAAIETFKKKQRKVVRKQIAASMEEIIKVALAEISKLEKKAQGTQLDSDQRHSLDMLWRDIAKAAKILSCLNYDAEKIEGLAKLVFATPYSYAKGDALSALANVNPGKAKDLARVWMKEGAAEKEIVEACVDAIFSGKVEDWCQKPDEIDPELEPFLRSCGIEPQNEIVGQDRADIFRAAELWHISDEAVAVLVQLKDKAVLPLIRHLLVEETYYEHNIRGANLAAEFGSPELMPVLRKSLEDIEAHFNKMVIQNGYNLDEPDSWASGRLFQYRQAQIALAGAIARLGDKDYAVPKLKELYEFHIRLEKTGRNLFDSSYSRRPILSCAEALIEIGELEYIVPELWAFYQDLDDRGEYTVGVSFVEPVGAIKSYEYTHMHEIAHLLVKAKADGVFDLVQYLWVKAINYSEDWSWLSLLPTIRELSFIDVAEWLNKKLSQWQSYTSRDHYLDERKIAETLIQLGDEAGVDYLASNLVEPLRKTDKLTYNIYLRLEAADILISALNLDKQEGDSQAGAVNPGNRKTSGFTLVELLLVLTVIVGAGAIYTLSAVAQITLQGGVLIFVVAFVVSLIGYLIVVRKRSRATLVIGAATDYWNRSCHKEVIRRETDCDRVGRSGPNWLENTANENWKTELEKEKQAFIRAILELITQIKTMFGLNTQDALQRVFACLDKAQRKYIDIYYGEIVEEHWVECAHPTDHWEQEIDAMAVPSIEFQLIVNGLLGTDGRIKQQYQLTGMLYVVSYIKREFVAWRRDNEKAARCVKDNKLFELYSMPEYRIHREVSSFWSRLYREVFIPVKDPGTPGRLNPVYIAVSEAINLMERGKYLTNSERLELLDNLCSKYKLGRLRILLQKALLFPSKGGVLQETIVRLSGQSTAEDTGRITSQTKGSTLIELLIGLGIAAVGAAVCTIAFQDGAIPTVGWGLLVWILPFMALFVITTLWIVKLYKAKSEITYEELRLHLQEILAAFGNRDLASLNDTFGGFVVNLPGNYQTMFGGILAASERNHTLEYLVRLMAHLITQDPESLKVLNPVIDEILSSPWRLNVLGSIPRQDGPVTYLRRGCAWVAGNCCLKEHIGGIIGLLSYPILIVRLEAGLALALLMGKEDVGKLTQTGDERDNPLIRLITDWVLAKESNGQAKESLRKAVIEYFEKYSFTDNILMLAMEASAYFDIKEAIPHLQKIADAVDPNKQVFALGALYRVGNDRIRKEVKKQLRDIILCYHNHFEYDDMRHILACEMALRAGLVKERKIRQALIEVVRGRRLRGKSKGRIFNASARMAAICSLMSLYQEQFAAEFNLAGFRQQALLTGWNRMLPVQSSKHTHAAGFSLIELLIALSIAVVLAVVGWAAFRGGLRPAPQLVGVFAWIVAFAAAAAGLLLAIRRYQAVYMLCICGQKREKRCKSL